LFLSPKEKEGQKMSTTPQDAEKSVTQTVECLKAKGVRFGNPLKDGAGTYVCTKPEKGEGFILIRNLRETIIIAFYPPDDIKGHLLEAVDEAIEARIRAKFRIPKEGIFSPTDVKALPDNLASALAWYNGMWQYALANKNDLSGYLDSFIGLAASHAKMMRPESHG